MPPTTLNSEEPLFPSAALEKASQRQSKIHLICLRSEVAFRLPFFLSKYR